MKIMRLIDKLFVAGALISLICMIIVVGIQVFFRFFIEATPHWTEEAARMFFIYSVAFGTGTGIKRGDFISLNLIGKYLSPANDKILQVLTDLAVIAFSLIIAVYSIGFVRLGMDERSPALEIPMGLVFISMVIIGAGICLFTLEHLYRTITGTNTQGL
jgi:TRAP-type transport system small permease protein